MRHFIGGAAVGFIFALWRIPHTKSAHEMDGIEFVASILSHLIVTAAFGLAAWGLWP
jgi:hypothetical protein